MTETRVPPYRTDDEYRYLPGSYRAFDELSAEVGKATAEKIQSLVEEMIREARA